MQVKSIVKKLDSINELVTNKIDLIKCDVEGAEFNVIIGGTDTIIKNLPIIVLELFHEWSHAFKYHPDQAIDFLKNLGYRVFLPLNGGMEEVSKYFPNDFDRQNYFFLHNEKHICLIEKLLIHQ